MHLIEIKNQIVEALIRKSSFGIDDFIKIKLDDELKDVRESIIREALKDLEDAKFIRGASRNPTDANPIKMHWVMETPVGYQGQEVEVGLTVASLIANIINRYREANKIEGEYCNALALTENDLQNLCMIVMGTLNKDEV